MTNWLWNLLNVSVALVGYHAAAFSIDWKWYGRKRMQVWIAHLLASLRMFQTAKPPHCKHDLGQVSCCGLLRLDGETGSKHCLGCPAYICKVLHRRVE